MENKLNPDIRFPGHTEDWERRKFKDFISRSGKKNSSGDNYPAYSVNNKLGLVSQSEQFDNSRLDNLDKKSYKLVKPNEFAYNPARINVGSIAFNNLNKTVIVSSLYVVLKMSEKLNNEFILQFIKSQPFINEVRRNTEGSVREYLFFDNFKNVKFPYIADRSEQVKIGNLLKQFDDTISIQEQELDTLKQTKQGFLQKMFPKEGESVPEIRFPGFTGEWEEHKLEELIEKGGSGGTPKSTNKSYYDGDIPFLAISDISNSHGYIDNTEKFISENGLENSAAWLVPKGAISLAMYASVGKLAILNIEVATSQAFYNMVFEDDSLRDFVYHRLYKANVSGEWTSLISTGTQANLNAKKIRSFMIRLPNDKEEISEIGSFFKKIDKTILFHQQELETLKQTKKAFSQKMFV